MEPSGNSEDEGLQPSSTSEDNSNTTCSSQSPVSNGSSRRDNGGSSGSSASSRSSSSDGRSTSNSRSSKSSSKGIASSLSSEEEVVPPSSSSSMEEPANRSALSPSLNRRRRRRSSSGSEVSAYSNSRYSSESEYFEDPPAGRRFKEQDEEEEHHDQQEEHEQQLLQIRTGKRGTRSSPNDTGSSGSGSRRSSNSSGSRRSYHGSSTRRECRRPLPSRYRGTFTASADATTAAPFKAKASEQPLLQLVAFDDIQQTFTRSQCMASGRWCCCCSCCWRQSLPLQRPRRPAATQNGTLHGSYSSTGMSAVSSSSYSSNTSSKDNRRIETVQGCRCLCGSCCCRTSRQGNENSRIAADNTDEVSPQGGLEAQLLSAGISATWGHANSNSSSSSAQRGGESRGSASFVVQQLASVHMGLPLHQQEQLRAATAANMATSFRQNPHLQARALLELGAASEAIPTWDLFLDYRKPSGLQQHPLLPSAIQLLRRLPRFALPLYDQQLLQGACEDSVLYPKLQGLEVPFRLLAHDLLFLATYSYLADLPHWLRPPIRLLRIVGFVLLNAELHQNQLREEQQQQGEDTEDEAQNRNLGVSRHPALEARAAAAFTVLEGDAIELDGASPEAMEAYHLQGLVLFNLQMIINDFSPTLNRIEVLCDGICIVNDNPYAALHSLTAFLQQHGFSLHSFRYKRGGNMVSSNSSTSNNSNDDNNGLRLTAATIRAVGQETHLKQHEACSTSMNSSSRNAIEAFIETCKRREGLEENRVQQLLKQQDGPLNRSAASCSSFAAAATAGPAAAAADSGAAACACCRCRGDDGSPEAAEAEAFLSAATAADSDELSESDGDDVDGVLRTHTLPADVYTESASRSRGLGKASLLPFILILLLLPSPVVFPCTVDTAAARARLEGRQQYVLLLQAWLQWWRCCTRAECHGISCRSRCSWSASYIIACARLRCLRGCSCFYLPFIIKSSRR